MNIQLQEKRFKGVQPDPNYKLMKNVIMNNKIRTHEYQESKRIVEIKRNN